VGVMIRSFPPHPNPLPCLRRSGFAQAGPRGEGRPFIPPAELRGILAYFDKDQRKKHVQITSFLQLTLSIYPPSQPSPARGEGVVSVVVGWVKRSGTHHSLCSPLFFTNTFWKILRRSTPRFGIKTFLHKFMKAGMRPIPRSFTNKAVIV